MKFFNPSLLLLIRFYIPDDERFPENGGYDNLPYAEFEGDNDNDNNFPSAQYDDGDHDNFSYIQYIY